VERERKAEEKRVEREEKAAKREREKQERDHQKAVKQAQVGKRKASQTTAPKAKRHRASGAGAAPVEAEPAVPAKLTRSGRAINTPSRYK
jgi:hypothetical protein